MKTLKKSKKKVALKRQKNNVKGMKFKNTLRKVSVRYIVFKEKDIWYAVGLEFNIVETGSNAKEAMALLFEALEGYVELARKIKSRPNILNQKIDPEYEEMWKVLQTNKKVPRKSIFTFGQHSFIPA